MLKLKEKKQALKDGEKSVVSPAMMRVTKDINDLKLPKTCKTFFPDPDNLFSFKLTISPDEGYYQKGSFVFDFQVPDTYPYDPPKVKCETEIYHPNIDGEGNVCLNILREDWKPVLSIHAVVLGLHVLLLEPNAEDPLNKSAAEVFANNKVAFERNVKSVMRKNQTGGKSRLY